MVKDKQLPPTPLFPVESGGDKKEDMPKNYIWDSIIQDAVNKVGQEAIKNRVSVSVTPVSKPYSLYNPHNYRLYFDFDTSNFKPKTGVHTPVVATAWRLINSTEVCFDEYIGFRIVVKRTQIEMTVKGDLWYKIYLEPIEGIKPQIVEICAALHTCALEVLKKFITEWGGHSALTLLNIHSENKVKLEDSIDTIPDKMTFRNEVLKKVYLEKNIEFSDPVFTANYLTTRAIEKVSPELSLALQGIGEGLKAIVQSQHDFGEHTLNPLTEQIALHLKVQRETLKTMKAIRKATEDKSRKGRIRGLLEKYGW